MIKELDVIVLTHSIPEYNLEEGSRGAVVHRYEDGQGFEVEFLDPPYILTLDRADISLDRASIQTEVVELLSSLPEESLVEVRDFAKHLKQKQPNQSNSKAS